MTDDHIFSIIFGILLIYLATHFFSEILIKLYSNYRVIGRIFIAIITLVFIQIVTLLLFDTIFTEFTWGSIGSALILAFSFPVENHYSE